MRRTSLKFGSDVWMTFASLTPGVITQITQKCTNVCTHMLTHTKPAYVVDKSVGNKVQPHSLLMASHPSWPSEEYSEMKYGEEF